MYIFVILYKIKSLIKTNFSFSNHHANFVVLSQEKMKKHFFCERQRIQHVLCLKKGPIHSSEVFCLYFDSRVILDRCDAISKMIYFAYYKTACNENIFARYVYNYYWIINNFFMIGIFKFYKSVYKWISIVWGTLKMTLYVKKFYTDYFSLKTIL